MQRISIDINGLDLDFPLARALADQIARHHEEECSLISWCDREKGVHSPQCLKCEIQGEPAWEIYGRNHGGRLRLAFGGDRFVFIYS